MSSPLASATGSRNPLETAASAVKPDDRIGLIGLGNVGMHYAERLLKTKGKLTVFDRDPSKMEKIVAAGGRSSSSSRQLAEACNVIVLALPNPQTVQTEMFGESGVLAAGRRGSLIIDISTIDPETSKHLYTKAKEHGYDYLEAPMSGGEPGGAGQKGAKKGIITFMVGGDEEAFEKAKPVLDVLGAHAILLGPAGTGNAVKLISNLIAGLNMAVMSEGFVLAHPRAYPARGHHLPLLPHPAAHTALLLPGGGAGPQHASRRPGPERAHLDSGEAGTGLELGAPAHPRTGGCRGQAQGDHPLQALREGDLHGLLAGRGGRYLRHV